MPEISNYTLTKKIYENEKTIIYSGKRRQDNLSVVIKKINDEHPDFQHMIRMQNEYEMNRRINSNLVVKIYEMNEKDSFPFLVTEDFGAESLQLFIKKHKLTMKEFLDISIKIVEALSDIHNAKIVHNDINPSNIVINTETDTVKVIDFGIATMIEVDNRTIGSFQEINGTLAYISPEQTGRMSRPIDYRTDFYSLGVTLYEILLGRLPFSAEDDLALIYSHLAKEPIPPHQLQSMVPEVVSDIIMKLMEKMAENRYQSAEGLKSDLLKCRDQFEKEGTIHNFSLGENDISHRFVISQKLYGREAEMKKLLRTFDRPDISSAKIITISGYSGVGKSSLVNELRRSIVNQKGFFAVGKFDQLKYSVSYSALIQVFDDILNQILSGSKEEIMNWKTIFLEKLGANCKIITNVIPTLELIVGSQPEVSILNPTEASNRFNFVFQTFVKTLCFEGHPLTIFLDDIHWCDLASLKLIERLLLDSEAKHLRILLSYRDNEVSGAHPLMLTLGSLEKAGIHIVKVEIKHLKLSHVCSLLLDTFHCDADKVTPLAELCMNKTEGNPFFLNQFLQVLYKENLIVFDLINRRWTWDLKLIGNTDITDNVVELMMRRINKLTAEAKQLLTLAACIGNRFNLKTLSIVGEKTKEETYRLINEALLEGLILLEENTSDSDMRWHFVHDRIQQAAYGFIEITNKKELHLKLGRLLLSNYDKQNPNENLFEILNHYNEGLELLMDLKEKEELAKLELIAGRKAKDAIAYEFAANYFKCGISLLGMNSWSHLYALMLELHMEAAEAYYLSGDFESMMKIISIVEMKVKTIIDRVNIYKILIQALAAQGKISEAIDIGINCFKLLGYNLSRKPSKAEIIGKLLSTRISFTKQKINAISELPLIENENILAVISIISLIGSISYRTDPLFLSYIVTEAIQILKKSGNSPDAPFIYGAYGLVLCSIGDINTGYLIGKLSLRLIEVLNVKDQKSKVFFINNAFISHWKEPIRELLPLFKEGYEAGLQVGDLEFAAYNGFYYCNKSFYAGENLEGLEKDMPFFIESIKGYKQDLQLYLTQMMCQLVYNLRGKNEEPTDLRGEMYDEALMLPLHIEAEDTTSVCSVYILKLILSYLFEEYDKAALNAELTEKYIESLKSTIAVPIYYFYSSLNELERYNDAPAIRQVEILKVVTASQSKMKKWAKHAPMNHINKYYLVEAERYRVLKKDKKAMEYYKKAIEFSNSNKLIQDEALSNELAAKFFIAKGDLKLGRFYIEEAHYLYLKWGATSKAKQIEKKYRSVFFKDIEAKRLNSMTKLYTGSTNSSIDKTISIDAATIIKSTQAISGEIILEELLKKLTYILIENAGAQKVIYLIKENNDYVIEAVGFAEQSEIEVLQGCPIKEYEDIPKGVVNYVVNSRELVILDRFSLEEKFTNDPYILECKPKSILCMPIVIKGEVSGVIYLENNLIEGAFSRDRLEILKVISSQLAISMENANIYKNLEVLKNTLEQKVEERTLELNESINKVYALLDNSGEGFLIFDCNFVIDSEYSSECLNIFSKDIEGLNVLELLFSNDENMTQTFSKTINIILNTKDEFKKDVLISLLPSLIHINTRSIKVKYKVLENSRFMLVLTDITHEKELEERVKAEQDRLKLIVASFTNKSDVLELVNSFRAFIQTDYKAVLQLNLGFDEKLSEIYRSIHTYKGSFSQFNFISLPKELHRIESELSQLKKAEADFENKALVIFEESACNSAFENDIEIITDILGEVFFKDDNSIFIDETAAIKLEEVAKIISEQPIDKLDKTLAESIEIMRTIRYKSIKEMLKVYIDGTAKLAEKLEKNICKLEIYGDDIKVDPYRVSGFIKSIVHVFRNAVDHGIETPEERVQAGKSDFGKITCRVEKTDTSIKILIEDDGRGIDIRKVKEKTLEKGIISEDKASSLTDDGLVDYIFSNSFSTKDSINELSGRGYGLSAVRREIEKLNGTIQVDTSVGRGTKFIFTFLL